MLRRAAASGLVAASALAAVSVLAQVRPDAFGMPLSHPAIEYASRPTHDRIARLNAQLQSSALQLTFDEANGYLSGVLAATHVPVESQLLVHSQTSAQADHITFTNPRALFFDDDLAIGWVPGAAALEIAVQDPEQGVIFYTLEQKKAATPRFTRDNSCLICHVIWETHGVPGFQVLSTFPVPDENAYASGRSTDHETPFNERWGGWFVTGRVVPTHHLGNLPVVRPTSPPSQAPVLSSMKGRLKASGYPADSSDVVALLVLEHQSNMANLITWLGWEARVAEANGSTTAAGRERIAAVAREVVDYLLFVHETPLLREVQGSSGFAEQFVSRGKKDGKGRSLREFDLRTRLFRYPCSYMIDSAAFAALPASAKQAVYSRMWQVLSGADRSEPYKGLALADRRAVAEILRDTHADLPSTFGVVTR